MHSSQPVVLGWRGWLSARWWQTGMCLSMRGVLMSMLTMLMRG